MWFDCCLVTCGFGRSFCFQLAVLFFYDMQFWMFIVSLIEEVLDNAVGRGCLGYGNSRRGKNAWIGFLQYVSFFWGVIRVQEGSDEEIEVGGVVIIYFVFRFGYIGFIFDLEQVDFGILLRVGSFSILYIFWVFFSVFVLIWISGVFLNFS